MTPGKLPGMTDKQESRSHCWRSVGGRWAVKFPDNTVPIISKMEDFSMTMYHFQCLAPFFVWCLIGIVGCWYSGNL